MAPFHRDLWDVAIAGAGPAGGIAAFRLARSGFSVSLIDRIDTDTHKVGESLPGAATRFLRSLDLAPFATSGLHGAIGGNLSAWDSATPIRTDFLGDPDGPGWRLNRHAFDYQIRTAAIEAGAVFHDARVRKLHRSETSIICELDDRESIVARRIIDATGRSASVARQLGAVRHRDVALSAVYALGRGEMAAERNRSLIEATPTGWWYAARLPTGHVIAGFHTFARNATRLARDPGEWQRTLTETQMISALLAGVVFDDSLGVHDAGGAHLDPVLGDAWVACGDAAQAFDPISSQGVFSALIGGARAADLIMQGGVTSAADYVKRLGEIRSTYLSRRQFAYRSQKRWPDAEFWVSQSRAK
jgi:flavin-dependent dehydrogenase